MYLHITCVWAGDRQAYRVPKGHFYITNFVSHRLASVASEDTRAPEGRCKDSANKYMCQIKTWEF